MPVGPALDAFKAHLERTGKIYPRPWCWKRFSILFQPACEPPWLTSWWAMSNQEKNNLFLKQVDYLAWHTDRFPAACRFLQELDDQDWFFTTEKPHLSSGERTAR